MQKKTPTIFFILIVIGAHLGAQSKEIDRLMHSEFKMTFPSIYFVNKSTEYAAMPYSADSCYKYIARHMEDIKGLVVWRDSSETEELTKQRIKKIKKGIGKHIRARRVRIKKVTDRQKISQRTIYTGTDSTQVKYLLSLNSVLDVSTLVVRPKGKKSHVEKPRWWCKWCWARGAFTAKYRAWHKRNFSK
jgi:hypothetical protein